MKAPYESAMLAAAADAGVSRRELIDRAHRLATENEELRAKLATVERERDEAIRQREAWIDSCRLMGEKGPTE